MQTIHSNITNKNYIDAFYWDVKIRQGRRQQELKKRNSFNKQNNSSASAAFPSRQDVKIPNCVSTSDHEIVSFILNLDVVLRNSISGGFA